MLMVALKPQLRAFLHHAPDQAIARHGGVKAQDRTGKFCEPRLLLRAVAALAGAVLVVRSPFNKLLGLAMAVAARRDRLGAEMGGFPCSDPRQPRLGRQRQKDHEVEISDERIAPAGEPPREDPV